ncbi:hypothetical protein ACHAXR_002181 [Thalassiosira sp. AJA248-18]
MFVSQTLTPTAIIISYHYHLQRCSLARRRRKRANTWKFATNCGKTSLPLVYSVDGIAWQEAKGAEKRLATVLATRWRRPYSRMVGYVKVGMALAVVSTNSLLICGSHDWPPRRPFIECGSALHAMQAGHSW